MLTDPVIMCWSFLMLWDLMFCSVWGHPWAVLWPYEAVWGGWLAGHDALPLPGRLCGPGILQYRGKRPLDWEAFLPFPHGMRDKWRLCPAASLPVPLRVLCYVPALLYWRSYSALKHRKNTTWPASPGIFREEEGGIIQSHAIDADKLHLHKGRLSRWPEGLIIRKQTGSTNSHDYHTIFISCHQINGWGSSYDIYWTKI